MDSSKLLNRCKCVNLVMALYFLKSYKKLNIEMDDLLLLMYFHQQGNKSLFNPNKYSEDLGFDLTKVMEIIDHLTEKGLIQVEVIKNEKGMREETVVLDGFYQKMLMFTLDEVNQTQDGSSIYETIEKEFGRTLSPMEYEIIKSWLDHNFKEEIIKEALREATFNGVSSLRYIDKILYEWGKNGVNSVEDVEKMRKKRNKKEEKEPNKDIDMNLMEWNWFDEEE